MRTGENGTFIQISHNGHSLISTLLTFLTPNCVHVNSVDMSGKKLTYHHGDLPEQITRIAWEKVRQSGADKLSLRSCAREAGVDPAAVYRHFKSREDLLGHLANRAFSELSTAMETAEAQFKDRDPKEALVQIGLAYIRYAVDRPHVFQMMFDIAGRYTGEGMSGASEEGRGAYDILVRAIRRLDPKTNVEVHIFTLWSVVHGFSKLANAGLGPGTSHFDHVSRAICENAMASIS